MKRSLILVSLMFLIISCDSKSDSSLEETNNQSYMEENIETQTRGNVSEEEAPQEISASEKATINSYRRGYEDGKMAYGLPASETASADEVIMAKGYNFSGDDYYAYKKGYEDAMYGIPSKY